MKFKTDQQVIREIEKEILHTQRKLMKLYTELDEVDDVDMTNCKLWLKAQQDFFNPKLDTSKPYWVK